MPDDERRIAEQIQYYRARAPEYDEWYTRRGRYDLGVEGNRTWASELAQAREALLASRPEGNILEVAAGTGYWTRVLAGQAASLTALDASPEALSLNRERVGDLGVRYVTAGVFSWKPEARYDYVFFAFWISHVPARRMVDFWRFVRASLAPEGRVFLIDNRRPSSITMPENPDAADPTVHRMLNDGRAYRIIKSYYTAETLSRQLTGLGWRPKIHETSRYFVLGSVRPDVE